MTFQSFDEDYVRRLTDGDSEAGDHFASYFGNVLFLKLRVRLRNLELIEDAKQETLMRVLLILRQRSGVKCPERFGAFVNGVCDNVVRELGREDRHEEPWDDKVEEPVDLTVDPDAGLISAEMKRVIRQVLAALPEKDRRILEAVYLEEIEKAQVCRMFNVQPAYLRVLLHRAKVLARKAYLAGAGPHAVNPRKG